MNTERPTPENPFADTLCRIDPMFERALRAEKLAEQNGKLAHDTAIELAAMKRERDEAREREAKWKAVAQMYRGAFDPDELTDQLSILNDADNAFDALRSEVEG
jgi:hypothetical protein